MPATTCLRGIGAREVRDMAQGAELDVTGSSIGGASLIEE
jgi:hypothetical protein